MPRLRSCPTGLKVVAIEARPAAVELKHKFDYRQLLITRQARHGRNGRSDADGQAVAARQRRSASPTTAWCGPRPTAASELTFTFGGQSVERAGHGQRRRRSRTRSASSATCSRRCRAWAATRAPATARRTARRASSSRSAATTRSTTTGPSPTTSAAAASTARPPIRA